MYNELYRRSGMFDRMNRRLYWTLVNFVKITGFLLVSITGIFLLACAAVYTEKTFGSAVPFVAFTVLCVIVWISWIIGKLDVDIEKMKQDSVERSLKRDWE